VDEKQAAQNQQLVTQWTNWINRGIKKKKAFTDTLREVDRFFEGADHRHLFANEAVKSWLNSRLGGMSTVNLAFQIRGWLAPNLYHRNPNRTVSVRTRDSVLKALAKVIEAYINYTPNETDLVTSSRSGIDESLLAGRGALFTGWDEETRLITSWQVSIDDIVIDPDARKVEDALWIAYRRRAPLYQVRQQYKATAEGLKGDRVSEASVLEDEKDSGRDDEAAFGETCDTVTVWEIYSKMGRGWRGKDVPDEYKNYDDAKQFVKLDIVAGHERPLFVGEWDTKIHADRAWPFTFLDLTPTRNKLWPVSLMAAAMGHQKSINLLTAIWMEKVKRSARDIFGALKSLPDPAIRQITSGGLDEVIKLGAEEGVTDIRQAVTKFETGAISPEIEKAIRAHEAWFAETTGLLPILKGLTNEQQVRSATEADIKDKNARSRLGDLSERVEDWHTRAARNEGILVRVQLKSDEVERVVPDLDLGYLVSWTNLTVEVPVRSAGKPEPTQKKDESDEAYAARLEKWAEGEVSLETVYPDCAHYFETEEEAQHHAALLLQALPAINLQRKAEGLPPFYFQTIATGAPLGFDGMPQLVPTVNVRKVTVADVWRDTRHLSTEDIARELSYRVEAGSTKRPDANKMIDMANMLRQDVMPRGLELWHKTGDPNLYNEGLERIYDAMQFPAELRVMLPPIQMAPPPPVPGAEGGGEAGLLDPAAPPAPLQPSIGASQ
jgi:hypothetical protein